MSNLIKKIKQLFCIHDYELLVDTVRYEYTNYKCKHCGKTKRYYR